MIDKETKDAIQTAVLESFEQAQKKQEKITEDEDERLYSFLKNKPLLIENFLKYHNESFEFATFSCDVIAVSGCPMHPQNYYLLFDGYHPFAIHWRYNTWKSHCGPCEEEGYKTEGDVFDLVHMLNTAGIVKPKKYMTKKDIAQYLCSLLKKFKIT